MASKVKRVYGTTADGQLTPCNAKKPEACWYHVKHYKMDDNQAREYNEDQAKAKAIASNVLSRGAITVGFKMPTLVNKLDDALANEAPHMTDRYNDMVRCGEFGPGAFPIDHVELTMDEDSVKYEFVYKEGQLYNAGYKMDTYYDDPSWKTQMVAIQKFVDTERSMVPSAGMTLGKMFDNMTFDGKYHELGEMEKLPTDASCYSKVRDIDEFSLIVRQPLKRQLEN